VTSSDVYGWPGIDVQLSWQSERTGIENKWFAVTGRVVAVKVEADGDLHIALRDAAGGKRALWFVKCRQNRSGVQFVKRFSVGRASRMTPEISRHFRRVACAEPRCVLLLFYFRPSPDDPSIPASIHAKKLILPMRIAIGF
jgi:hypothetical protein